MKSRNYELLVREIFQQLLNQDSIPSILVEHDVVKQGLKTRHQIDVYWEFKLAGITHRVVVQAKNWARRINKAAVLTFEAVLRDLPGQPRGIMVTAKGCQKGALEVAKACGILIYEFKEEAPRPPIELYYTGLMRYVVKGYCKATAGRAFGLAIDTTIVNPEFSNLMVQADPAWVRDNRITLPSTDRFQYFPHELEFYDSE